MRRFDNAPKKAINLSLNSKVLEVARELGMNVSQTVEALLAKEVERRYWEQWKERNKEAIDVYNARIRSDGIWGAKHRTFARSLGDGRASGRNRQEEGRLNPWPATTSTPTRRNPNTATRPSCSMCKTTIWTTSTRDRHSAPGCTRAWRPTRARASGLSHR